MPIAMKVEINDNVWNDLLKDLKKLDGKKIKIGYWGSGNPSENLAYRGAIHTFGIPAGIKVTNKMRNFLHAIGIHLKKSTTRIYIPQRPFMQNAVDNNRDEIETFIARNYILFLQNRLSAENFLKRIGIKHMDQIKNSIRNGSFKGLHPVTVTRKRSTKPLVGQGAELLNRVDYKITR